MVEGGRGGRRTRQDGGRTPHRRPRGTETRPDPVCTGPPVARSAPHRRHREVPTDPREPPRPGRLPRDRPSLLSSGHTSMETPVTCLDENTVLAFLDGHVTADARAAIERHLDECRACLDLVSVA